MENSQKTGQNRGSAILSYSLSLIFLLLGWLFPKTNIVDFIFIFIHLFIIAIGILVFLWIYLAVGVAFISGKMKNNDKSNTKLIMKTMPDRIILSLLYWLLPIGLYVYHITQFRPLYLFVWLPVWYPIMYFFIEKKIKNKEKELKSPVVDYW